MRSVIFSFQSFTVLVVFSILSVVTPSFAGIVTVKGFSHASAPDSDLFGQINLAINGSGLSGNPSNNYDYIAYDDVPTHSEVTLEGNSWMYQYDTSYYTPIDVILELQPSLNGTWVDAFCLWNLNKGDARRAALDGTGGYLDQQFWGITGVNEATLFYSSDNTSTWIPISNLSFAREETEQSTIQVKPFSPVQATHFKLTLKSAFGLTRNFDNTVDRYRIGFAEVAYREYIPPAPPVVPEPGSIAVFGGLMAVGGLMRWRRRRSVGG